MDVKRLKELVCYLPRSGMFFQRVADRHVCSVIGRRAKDGYVAIVLDGRSFLAHRLAWLYVHGKLPDGLVIDHINGVKNDNRIENLRLVSAWQNSFNNRSRRRDGGLVGAYWVHDSRWEAVTQVDGRRVLLGFYPTEEQAHRAYLEFNASVGRVPA